MKKFVFYVFVASLMMLIMSNSGCDREPNSNTQLAQKQESLMQEANRQVGMPAIVNFQERKLMKTIIEARDQENLICYCYLANEMNGTIGQFIGKCLGYGLPYSTQFTNPEKIAYEGSYGILSLPQADPNGLFMPSSADGTWVFLIDPATNEPHPVFFEPKVIISPFKLN